MRKLIKMIEIEVRTSAGIGSERFYVQTPPDGFPALPSTVVFIGAPSADNGRKYIGYNSNGDVLFEYFGTPNLITYYAPGEAEYESVLLQSKLR